MKKLTLIFIAFVISTFTYAQCDHDATNPWFDNFVTNITVECNDDLSFLIPDAFDDCDTLVDIAWYEETTPNNWCPNSFTIFRVYRAYDDFGNQVVESQTVYVVDETPPTFLYTPPNINEGCYQNFVLEEPIIEDNCSNYVLVDTFTIVSDDPCNYIAYRTLTAVDECGNSETKIQSISLIDTIPPAIVGEQYIEVNPNQNLDTIFITVSDNCNEPYVYYTDLETSGNNIIRTYRVFDSCGNQSVFEQIIHINTNNNHVTICHRLGNGGWIQLSVAQPAVQAHLNHGDYLGPCNEYSQSEILPYGVKLEQTPNGNIKKYTRCK
jgi:hypothetical protein